MKIIDERKENKNTFGKLKFGEWFIDSNEMFCLKTDDDKGLYMNSKGEWYSEYFGEDEIIIPLAVEVHIIR